ncbi:MAG TPA: zf-HC2 domain-containing protein [Vicinamibacterales bacterium]|nr:zf-HC2 domain-containing protein [Vicinamibacterales bacterium]
MSECSQIDPLVTPFVDGALPHEAQETVARHLAVCSACRARVDAERAVRSLVQTCRGELIAPSAPPSLKARCNALKSRPAPAVPLRTDAASRSAVPARGWRARLTPFALAATLLLAVGGAFIFQATRSSSRVLAAELTLDHEKCFRLNALLRTQHSPAAVEASMASGFNWNVQLPSTAEGQDVSLVGSRPCLYGEGKVAHIMYRHHGQPVSLFMLPGVTRKNELVQVFGHQAKIWSEGNRTFVLVARESPAEMDQMVALVRTTIR